MPPMPLDLIGRALRRTACQRLSDIRMRNSKLSGNTGWRNTALKAARTALTFAGARGGPNSWTGGLREAFRDTERLFFRVASLSKHRCEQSIKLLISELLYPFDRSSAANIAVMRSRYETPCLTVLVVEA